MPERGRLEFTGERVVPGQVDADLLNEHLARYRFAARFAEGAMVLDAGCGTGYGAAELSRASKVVGVDASAEAAGYARGNFSRPSVHFLRAVCESLPFADGSFDLVLAFEVIEHLERWQDFLAEARRVLRPAGLLLVSTPNKAYYAEARGTAGANPYHVREFEFGEFESVLRAVFPNVNLWTQNHSDVIVFNRVERSAGDFDALGDDRPEQAHFFLAACSRSPIPEPRAFAWSPVSGNVLRDRERHIGLLESELAKKDEWLRQTQAVHATLQESHEQVLAELEGSNEWAGRLNAELAQTGRAIADLQQEVAKTHEGYRGKVRRLEAELKGSNEWAGRLNAELTQTGSAIADLQQELAKTHDGYREKLRQLETELKERNEWAERLNAELTQAGSAVTGLQQELATTHAGYRDKMRQLEAELEERNEWAERLNAELTQAGRAVTGLQQELATTHAGYRDKMRQLEAELEGRNEWAGRLNAELTQAGSTIAGLQQEVATTHAGYREKVRQLETEMEGRNEWAGRLNAELTQAGSTIAGLQQEVATTHAGYREKVRQLEAELAARLEWARNLGSQVERLERELIERTQWAQSLQAELTRSEAELGRSEAELARSEAQLALSEARLARSDAQLALSVAQLAQSEAQVARSEAQLRLAANSKWVRLGRRLHLGPEIVTGSGRPE